MFPLARFVIERTVCDLNVHSGKVTKPHDSRESRRSWVDVVMCTGIYSADPRRQWFTKDECLEAITQEANVALVDMFEANETAAAAPVKLR